MINRISSHYVHIALSTLQYFHRQLHTKSVLVDLKDAWIGLKIINLISQLQSQLTMFGLDKDDIMLLPAILVFPLSQSLEYDIKHLI